MVAAQDRTLPVVVKGACPHDCPDTCAWQVTVENGVAVDLAGAKDHPFTRGGLCAKVNHYLERVYSPDRLLHPLRRVGPKGAGQFVEIGWDQALDEVAGRLAQIVDRHGSTAILPYSYLGTQGIVQSESIDRRFFARLGATRLERAICQDTASAGIGLAQGTSMGMLPEDFVHSRLIVLWGTNTIVTNLHLWPFIREAKANGATIVVIDPLRSRTAAAADWHIRPMPGTDAALALGMMHVIVEEGLQDDDYVSRYTVGFDQLRERLRDYPPARTAMLTGLEADEIVRIARAYATTRPAAIRVFVGMEHHAHGANLHRAIACLPALVGAWRDRGGGLDPGTWQYFDEALKRVSMPELEDSSTRSVNMVQLGRALANQLEPADPPIRALVVYNSNPAATAPNQQLVLAGLRREDLFTVVIEQFMTDTALHADVVLPATTEVEHRDLVPSWGHTYLTLNLPAIEPVGEALPNSEIFRRLATRMGFEEPYLQDSDEAIIREALASGHPWLEGVTFERLMSDGWAKLNIPEPWLPYAEGGFPTASGRFEFASDAAADVGLDPLPGYVAARESPAGDPDLVARYPLALMTAKPALHFLNSSYSGLPRHLAAEGEPLLDIHPADAEPRGISEGDGVRVFNDRGVVRMRARLGDRVRPGLVAMPSGWWASRSPGGTAANTLTADGLSDLGGGGDFHDTLVEVARDPELAGRSVTTP